MISDHARINAALGLGQLGFPKGLRLEPDGEGDRLGPNMVPRIYSAACVYRLSHWGEWGERPELNRRHPDPQSGALTN